MTTSAPQAAVAAGLWPRTSKHWVSAVAFALSGGLLYLALRRTDWVKLWGILRVARCEYLALSATLIGAGYALRSARWHVLISGDGTLPLRPVFGAAVAGYLGNAFLPARAGEFVRATTLSRASGLETSFVLATVMSERLYDAVAVVLFGMTSLAVLPNLPTELRTAFGGLATGGVAGVCVFALVPRFESVLTRGLRGLSLTPTVLTRLHSLLASFFTGLRACQQPSRWRRFAVLTVVVWLTDAVVTTIQARALGLSLSVPQSVVLVSALGIASALPSAPGGLGVTQYVAVTLLPMFGYDNERALALVFLMQACGYATLAALGALVPVLLGRPWSSRLESAKVLASRQSSLGARSATKPESS